MWSRKYDYCSKKNKKKIYYQSSYELIAYKKLEKTSEVISYGRGPRIKYKDENGEEHCYFVDILVECKDGRKYLIEIKSEYYLKKDEGVNKRKFKAAKKFCKRKGMRFKVWTEDKLFSN